jgi:hypothetical protein
MLFTAGAAGVQVPGERKNPVCAELVSLRTDTALAVAFFLN